MEYRIRRGTEEFGPYSLSDLQQYMQSGHVVGTDEAKSEGMDDWVPVSKVLGDIPAPATSWAGSGTIMATDLSSSQELVRLPPNLHWGWLLAIDLLTRSYFNFIWALVQANWARKLSGKNTSVVLTAMYPAGMISGLIAVTVGKMNEQPGLGAIGGILILAGTICLLVGVFSIRSAMEDYYNRVENIGLSLSGAMTFFFGTVYLQYHINQIALGKKTSILS